MIADLPCAVCGTPSAHAEVVAPGGLPAAWAEWGERRREIYVQYHDPRRWRWIYEGPAAGDGGGGSDVGQEEAARIIAAFTPPVTAARVRAFDGAGLYDCAGICGECGDLPYCRDHWRVTASGFGTCPRGHGKSLDPHWSPEW